MTPNVPFPPLRKSNSTWLSQYKVNHVDMPGFLFSVLFIGMLLSSLISSFGQLLNIFMHLKCYSVIRTTSFNPTNLIYYYCQQQWSWIQSVIWFRIEINFVRLTKLVIRQWKSYFFSALRSWNLYLRPILFEAIIDFSQMYF